MPDEWSTTVLRRLAARVIPAFLLSTAACGGAAPTSKETPEALFRSIDARRHLVVQSLDEIRPRIAERDADVARFVAMGASAARLMYDKVAQNLGDRSVRQFWLPILLDTEDADTWRRLGGIVERLSGESLEEFEWLTIAYKVRRRREEWAFRLEVTLAGSADAGTRRNAVEALLDWDRPEAREAVLRGLADPDDQVRTVAAEAGGRSAFGGSLDELEALVRATEDRSPFVAGAAEESLERVLLPGAGPPPIRARTEDMRANPRTYASLSLKRWRPWLDTHRPFLVWDPRTRRFGLE